MKTICTLTLFLLSFATVSVAAGARVEGDLSVNGVVYLSDGTPLSSSSGLLKDMGAWASGATYSAGEIVQHLGSSYTAITASKNQTPPDPSFWSVLASQGPKGDTGVTGAAGPAGTTGQTSSTVFGSTSLTVTTGTQSTVNPGLTTTITVPASAVVLLTTDGSISTTSTAVTGFSVVDVFLSVDGVIVPNGGYQRVIAANTGGYINKITAWSMSQVITVTAGSHTFAVRAIGVSSGGASDATVSGNNTSPNQGTLNAVILKL